MIAEQLPGCLPPGATLDSLISVEQFALWRGLAPRTAADFVRAGMPGVVRDKAIMRVHPRTYLCQQGKQFKESLTAIE